MNNIIHNIKLSYLASFINQDFKILGIDFGIKKIGTAIFYRSLDNIIPLSVVTNFKSPTIVIKQLVREYSCIAVVIGITNDSHIKKNVLKLQKTIEAELEIPVLLQDETLTTYAANEILKDMGIKRANRSKVDDAIAAELILESFIWDLRRYIYTNKKD